MTIPKKDLHWMYEMSYKIRYFEETLEEAYTEGKTPIFNIGAGTIPGEMHLSNGQEPAAVGIGAHLKKEDNVFAPHRLHHFALAKNVNINKMTAEIFGKKTGLSKGKGGHMHIFDPEVNFASSGIIASGMPPAIGTSLAAKMRNQDYVSVINIGEGAANQGAFHESLNLAALWNLPYIVVVENNKWGISVEHSKATSVPDNSYRAGAYGIDGYVVRDNNPLEMYRVSKEAVEKARNGGGPSIIEIETYRFLGHFQGDAEGYRPEDEVDSLKEKDALPSLYNYILNNNYGSEEELKEMEERAKTEVDEAFAFARESDYPEAEDALKDVFV